jgi:hypothetical protein
MPWVKFSDDWYDDDKLAGASSDVLAMFSVGLTWCARNLTDGKVPSGVHRILVNLHGDPDEVVAELVARTAWQEVPGGWVIGNYLRYQPARAEVLAKREKDAARKRTGRVREESAADSDQDNEASPAPPGPVPGPVDPPVVVSECDRHEPQPVDDGSDGGVKAEAWWQITRWKAEDKGKVEHVGWCNSTRRNQPTDPHPDGGTFDEVADRILSEHPELTGHELAQALTGRLSKRTLAMRAS